MFGVDSKKINAQRFRSQVITDWLEEELITSREHGEFLFDTLVDNMAVDWRGYSWRDLSVLP